MHSYTLSGPIRGTIYVDLSFDVTATPEGTCCHCGDEATAPTVPDSFAKNYGVKAERKGMYCDQCRGNANLNYGEQSETLKRQCNGRTVTARNEFTINYAPMAR